MVGTSEFSAAGTTRARAAISVVAPGVRSKVRPMVISRNFQPGFRIALHQKDLRNALLAAESMKVSLPLTSTVQNVLMALMNDGKGSLDHSAIVTFTEKMAGVEIKKAATAKA